MINELNVEGNVNTVQEEYAPPAWNRDELEFAILGCFLYDDECDIDLLSEDDFAGKNKEIFGIIKQLKQQKEPTDFDSIID